MSRQTFRPRCGARPGAKSTEKAGCDPTLSPNVHPSARQDKHRLTSSSWTLLLLVLLLPERLLALFFALSSVVVRVQCPAKGCMDTI